MPKLILGCGYLGLRVARQWLAAGHEVYAVTRSVERAAQLNQEGLRPIFADVTGLASLGGHLSGAKTVLYAIGYDPKAGKSRQDVQLDGLKAVLDALAPQVERLIYISTTGVYAQTDGQWVDEESECRPTREAATVALSAESIVRNHALAGRSFVLRLAGIYGPSRIPHRDDLVAGRAIAAPPGDFLNLIHVDDAVSAVLAVEAKGTPPRTFLVSDGQPVRRSDFFAEYARLVGAPPPRFEIPAPEILAASRSGTNKRVSNARIRSDVDFSPRYPSYREGLGAIIRESGAAETH
jgi:nucleoside-diphosphate-sugar epimerase